MGLLIVLFIFIIIVIFLAIYQEHKEAKKEKREEEWKKREEEKRKRREEIDKQIKMLKYQTAVDFAKKYPQGIIFSTKEEIPERWRESRYFTITYVLDKENRVIGYKVMKKT